MYRIILYLKRRGFSLAEVLVATVIAGYCIMPIVGSMQGGIRHTENFNHREKLRILARSRLNQELAAGAFDHKSIDTSPSYHYVYIEDNDPNYKSADSRLATDSGTLASFTAETGISSLTDIIFAYQTSVMVKENINLSTTTVGLQIDPKYLNSLGGLKAIVVKAELLDGPNVIATDSLSYFSLINLPSFGDQFIWISNSSMLRILAVDSTTRAIAETFQMPIFPGKALDKAEQDPFRPWNIDLHPSRRVLGIQSKSDIKLLNLDKSHASYQQPAGLVSIAAHPSAGLFADVKADPAKAEEDRGIVFRPDGKYFFVTSHSNMYLYVYGINIATATALNWPPASATFITGVNLSGDATTNSAKHSDLIAGNDGYLYLAIKDKDNLIRFPMYPNSFTSGWSYEKLYQPMGTDDVNSSWTSKDGKYVYVMGDNKKVVQYRSNPLSRIGMVEFTADDNLRDFKLSHDSRYLLMTDKKDASNLGGLRSALINSINFAANPTGVTTQKAYPGYKLKSDLAVLSPNSNEVLFSHKDKPELYFVGIASLAAGTYNTGIPADRILIYDSAAKPSADIVSRTPDYLLVGAGNTAGDSTIELLDLNTYKFDVNSIISGLRGRPRTIGISAQSARFKIGYDAAVKGVDAYNMIDGSQISIDELSGNSKIVAYAADDETFRNSSGIATYSNNFYANLEIPGSGGTFNGYFIMDAPISSFGDSGMNTAWVPQDMKAMPNGGFLMLLKKADGTAMLDWIGKIKWGTDKGKYLRFARWVSSANDNFPPLHAQNLAISPDEKFLAIECIGTPNKVFLYDFAANNFGHETQMPGLITDFRVTGNALDVAVPATKRFTGGGIKLKETFTANHAWTNLRTGPLNFLNAHPDVLRIFGYFQPKTTLEKFYLILENTTRLFVNSPPEKLLEHWSMSTTMVGPGIRQIASDTSIFIQSDNGNDAAGNAGLAVMYATDTAAIAPVRPADANPIYATTSNWTHITASETRPFNFTPTFLRAYDLTGCTNDPDSALAFSRDLANPILFQFDTVQDDVWTLKPGKSFTRIDVGGSIDVADKQLTVSPDGQKLIFAEDTGSNRIFITNIGNPDSFAFAGSPVTQSTIPVASFGSLITTVSMDTPPRALAAIPFNTQKSTSHLGRYESVGTLSAQVYGKNNAALASGAIFIMGGSTTNAAGTPSNKIFVFNPMAPTTVSPITATLTQTLKLNSVVPYDNKIYSFNGAITSTNTDVTAWVQRYDPVTGQVISSTNPPVTGALIDLQVSFNQATLPAPTSVTHTGAVYSTFTGLKAFDGDKTTYGNQWSPSTANQIVTYNTGNASLKFPVNKIKISNYDSNASVDALHDFAFYGDATLLLTSLTSSFNTTQPFDIPNSTAYQTYKLKAISKKDGGAADGFTVSELELFLSGVRKIPDYDMTNYAVPGPDSVTSSGDISGERAWQAFDSDPASSRWTCSNNANQHITLTLGTPDILDIVSIRCNSTGRVNNFKIQAADQTDFSDSVDLKIGGPTGSTVGVHQDTTSSYLYFLEKPTKAYKHYRLFVQSVHSDSDIEVSDLQFYSTVPPTPVGNGPEMTKTMNDARQTISACNTSACMTPYGIVTAGGYTSGGTATTTALVYWPHGLDSYDSGNPPSPIAWYELNETSGTIAKNIRGINAGTVTNPVWTAGKIKNGLQLDGSSTRITATRPVQDDFTIACWIKTTSIGNGLPHFETVAIVHAEAGSINDDFGFGIDSNGKLTYGDGKTGFTDKEVRTTASVNNNTWRHVAVTRTKSTGAVKLYIDGNQSASGICNTGNSLTDAANIYIGYSNDAGGNNYLNGMIDDVRFYNTALTDDHIKRIMTGDLRSEGISRAIPPMNTAVFGHNLVWHKGKIFRIGGYTAGTTNATNINIFDFDTNAWTTVANNVASFTDITGTTVTLPQPADAGVCSFGDEIYIFGGMIGATATSTARAWNPESRVVRLLDNLPSAKAGLSAVPCGSSIYLVTPGTGNTSIFKFTP